MDGYGDGYGRRGGADPLYRSTFVLAYRSDLGLAIKSLMIPP